jgi:hypothetical protein
VHQVTLAVLAVQVYLAAFQVQRLHMQLVVQLAQVQQAHNI